MTKKGRKNDRVKREDQGKVKKVRVRKMKIGDIK